MEDLDKGELPPPPAYKYVYMVRRERLVETHWTLLRCLESGLASAFECIVADSMLTEGAYFLLGREHASNAPSFGGEVGQNASQSACAKIGPFPLL